MENAMDILERLKIIAETTSADWPTASIDWEYREAVKEIERLRNDLAAAQAREAKLRDALKEAVGWNWLDEDAPQIPLIDEASALPNDDTALRERLKAERERCAKLIEYDERGDIEVTGRGYYDQLGDAKASLGNAVDAIRALED